VGLLVLTIVVFGVVGVFIWWSRRAALARGIPEPPQLAGVEPLVPVPIQDGIPKCSACGGTSFVPRRLTSTKVFFGLWSLLGRPQHTECVVCGKLYSRPNL
jgi:hypothetical protein